MKVQKISTDDGYIVSVLAEDIKEEESLKGSIEKYRECGKLEIKVTNVFGWDNLQVGKFYYVEYDYRTVFVKKMHDHYVKVSSLYDDDPCVTIEKDDILLVEYDDDLKDAEYRYHGDSVEIMGVTIK
jgi:hypothetical protein